MSEFKKLTEKEVVESVSKNGHLFAEDGGKIVRIPAASVGGGEPIIIVSDDFGNDEITCNFTFEEVYNKLKNNIFYPAVFLANTVEGVQYLAYYNDYTDNNTPCVGLTFVIVRAGDSFAENVSVYYKADGTLTQFNPNGK